MKKSFIVAGLLSSLVIFNSCDKVSDATGVCAKKWATYKPVSTSLATAEISGGALVFSAPSLKSGVNYTVNQASVSGDFEATATFEGFTPGAQTDITTAFLQFAAIPMSSTEVANTGISNVSGGTTSGIFAGTNADSKAFANKTDGLRGTLKIKRVGSELTITTSVYSVSITDGSEVSTTSTAVKSDFGTSNVNIGFQFGAVNDVNKAVTAKITNFTITGGGMIALSDSFDCNSLIGL